MYGLSGSAINTWITALGDPEQLTALKAIVTVAGFASVYDAVHMDGTANVLRNEGDSAAYGAYGAISPSLAVAERGCAIEHNVAATDTSGDFTPYWQEREHRDGIAGLRAATLVAHGVHDVNVLPRGYAGLLDRWPADVPLKVMVGSWKHGLPSSGDGNAAARRNDWIDVVTAWFDRWLKSADTGVEDWPAYQMQDATGRWRVEHRWVSAARTGTLALSEGGVLGAASPAGSTSYIQGSGAATMGEVSFTTPLLERDLHVYGDPVLELAVKVTDRNARIGVRLDVVDEIGVPRPVPYSSAFGARSMRHLDPYVDGRFSQVDGRDPELETVIRTTVRLQATDMLVPAGSRLRLTLYSLVGAEPARPSGGPVWPPETVGAEGTGGTITVVHDCEMPTVLRFAMADPNAKTVQIGSAAVDPSSPIARRDVDGGGIAVQRVCGRRQ